MIPDEFDVAVVGAGIVGAACALEFARERLRVAVIDAGDAGGGATAAGMGHVVVMADSEAQFALSRYSQLLWDELAPSLPPECAFSNCGTIWVAADGEELDAAARKQAYYAERDVASELLNAKQLARFEPNLRPGLVGGLRVPGDSVVYPPRVVGYLLEEARLLGARILLGTAVTKIADETVHLQGCRRLKAAAVVNASGHLAARVMPGWSIRPRKGHLLVTDRYPGFVHHHLVELGYLKKTHAAETDSVAFTIQARPTGQCLIGSSRQFDSDSLAVNTSVVERLLRHALQFMPALAQLCITRIWTGFRAATPDNLPLIGPVPGHENHYLATGHEGLGITTAFGTARLLAGQMLGRPAPIPAEPYLPSRFAPEVSSGG